MNECSTTAVKTNYKYSSGNKQESWTQFSLFHLSHSLKKHSIRNIVKSKLNKIRMWENRSNQLDWNPDPQPTNYLFAIFTPSASRTRQWLNAVGVFRTRSAGGSAGSSRRIALRTTLTTALMLAFFAVVSLRTRLVAESAAPARSAETSTANVVARCTVGTLTLLSTSDAIERSRTF